MGTKGRGLVLGIKAFVPGMQGDGFATELGGIIEVLMWLCASLLVGLRSSIQLCCVGSRQRTSVISEA